MSALRRGIAALAAAAVIAPIAARAADVPVIRVFPPQCEAAPVSIDAFVDSLRVELAGRQPHCCVVGPGGDGAADALKVTLAIEPCDAATQAVGVAVDVASPPRTIERQVSLADLPPEARPRALALAVAELIRSAAAPAETAAPPPAPPPAAPAPRGLVVAGSVAGEVHRYLSRDTTFWGPRLGLSLSGAQWHVTLDAGAASSRTEVSVGDISFLQATASLFIGPRFAAGPVIVNAGAVGTLGWARVEGRSDVAGVTAAREAALISTCGFRAAAEGPASGVLRLLGYVEAGFTLRRLDADVDGQPAAGISGPYLMFAAGVKFGPS